MKTARLISVLLVFGFFLLDRFIKQATIHSPPRFMGGFFYSSLFINKAGPFSLSLPNFFLMALAVGAFGWLTYLGWQSWYKKETSKLFGVGLMLVGGFSNFWDRIIIGGVVDVWHLELLRGLSFNLADIYLLVGVLVVVHWYYRHSAPSAS